MSIDGSSIGSAALSPEDLLLRDSDKEYPCQGFLHALSLATVVLGWSWGGILIALQAGARNPIHWVAPAVLIASGVLTARWHETHLPTVSSS